MRASISARRNLAADLFWLTWVQERIFPTFPVRRSHSCTARSHPASHVRGTQQAESEELADNPPAAFASQSSSSSEIFRSQNSVGPPSPASRNAAPAIQIFCTRARSGGPAARTGLGLGFRSNLVGALLREALNHELVHLPDELGAVWQVEDLALLVGQLLPPGATSASQGPKQAYLKRASGECRGTMSNRSGGGSNRSGP